LRNAAVVVAVGVVELAAVVVVAVVVVGLSVGLHR
jgi:hypothetical protein